MARPSTRRRVVRPNPHRKEPVPIAVVFGARVRKLREEQAYTFDAFVEETQLGRGYISELERGMVVPSLATLARLAAAFEMTLSELLAYGDATAEQILEVARHLTGVQQRRLLREAKRMKERKRTA